MQFQMLGNNTTCYSDEDCEGRSSLSRQSGHTIDVGGFFLSVVIIVIRDMICRVCQHRDTLTDTTQGSRAGSTICSIMVGKKSSDFLSNLVDGTRNRL